MSDIGDDLTPSATNSRDALLVALAARAKAEQAQRDIDSHEDVCAERYENIHAKLTEMKTEFSAQNRRIWGLFGWLGGTGFLILMGVLSFLLRAQYDTITAMSKASRDRIELRDRIEAVQPLPPQVIIQRAPGSPEIGATVEHQP